MDVPVVARRSNIQHGQLMEKKLPIRGPSSVPADWTEDKDRLI